MKISIIMPVYNAQDTILKTLEKLTKQKFDDFELVITNDGSQDETESIIKNFMNNNNLNWQLINQGNKGPGEARNTGLENAKGKYILFLDADDYLDDYALEKLYTSMISDNYDLSFSSYAYVSPSGKQNIFAHNNRAYSQYEMMKLFGMRVISIGIGNSLIKKSIIRDNNIKFKKFKLGEDNLFFREFLLHSHKFISIKDNLFFYIYNPKSVTKRAYSFDGLDSIHSVIDTIKEYTEKKIDKEIIEYFNVFLISEIRGNATKFLKSRKESYDISMEVIHEKMLSFMPNNLSLKIFFSTKRTLWLLKMLIFYKFPIATLKMYKIFHKIK